MKRRKQVISEWMIQTVERSDIHMIINPVSHSYQYNNLTFRATAYPIFPIELLSAFFVIHQSRKGLSPTFSCFMVGCVKESCVLEVNGLYLKRTTGIDFNILSYEYVYPWKITLILRIPLTNLVHCTTKWCIFICNISYYWNIGRMYHFKSM